MYGCHVTRHSCHIINKSSTKYIQQPHYLSLFFFSFWLKTQLSVSDREHVIYCVNFISLIIKIIITIIIITLKFIYYCWHLSLTFILNFIISSSFFELCAHTTKTYRGWIVRQELCVIVSCRFRGEFCYVWLLSLIRRV